MRRRILTSILLVIAATVFTLGVPLSFVSWRLVADLTKQELAGRLENIAISLSKQGAEGQDASLSRLELLVPPQGRLLISMTGHIAQTVGERVDGPVITEKLTIPGGELKLSIPAEAVRGEQYEALALVGVAVLLSVLVGTIVAVITARRLATPMTDVARRAARLGAGDFRTSARRYDIAELDRVAEVLDSSATEIGALIRRERDLAGDISHQLRTRLTGLRLRLEELSMHPDSAVVEEVQAALDQTDRLVTVVDDLLANARSRRAAGATELLLGDELSEVKAEWEPAFTAVGRSLQIRCPRRATVHATGVRLREAIGVLIDNALAHGSGTVRVSVRPGEPMVVIEVADEGTGVPDALVGHIFDRGVSTADSTGIGLGLARAFIEADGGRLELRRARPPVFGVFLAAGGRPEPDGTDSDGTDSDGADADGAELDGAGDSIDDVGDDDAPDSDRTGSGGGIDAGSLTRSAN